MKEWRWRLDDHSLLRQIRSRDQEIARSYKDSLRIVLLQTELPKFKV